MRETIHRTTNLSPVQEKTLDLYRKTNHGSAQAIPALVGICRNNGRYCPRKKTKKMGRRLTKKLNIPPRKRAPQRDGRGRKPRTKTLMLHWKES